MQEAATQTDKDNLDNRRPGQILDKKVTVKISYNVYQVFFNDQPLIGRPAL